MANVSIRQYTRARLRSPTVWALVGCALLGFALVVCVGIAPLRVHAEGDAGGDVEAWRTSPFHGVPNAATGLPIPCQCRYQGSALPLGAKVCLHTRDGPRLARCDLLLNNSTWVPTDAACDLNS
jgi:hypothetical protein